MSLGGVEGELNIVFTSREKLMEMNKTFLKHDAFTDVITFDYCQDNEISGDVYISLPDVKENSVVYGTRINDEIDRVMAHGILHLIGYNDKSETEKKQMRKMEEHLLGLRNWTY